MSSTSTSALAFEGEKNPKASIVAITPIAKSMASPKEVPILVFMYLFLLRLEVGLREVFVDHSRSHFGLPFGTRCGQRAREAGPIRSYISNSYEGLGIIGGSRMDDTATTPMETSGIPALLVIVSGDSTIF